MSSCSPEVPAGKAPKARVLVVEDEAMVSEVVCAILEIGGYAATHAEGAAEALKLLRDPANHYDLLLTDFRMPRVTGIELIQEVRSLRPDLKTVLYSGNVDERVLRKYKVQPDRFLRKPFTPKVLNQLVREMTGS